ncbi:unnamed protein product [Paramecium octaurelia]|uniref:Uncharacterized protein n=1 Tax=Paramecium octaurelia TaxID=43137 RepID=A0A8S1YJP7_PAROT|nr:unnamed protein product [Paramecium octaurelia]
MIFNNRDERDLANYLLKQGGTKLKQLTKMKLKRKKNSSTTLEVEPSLIKQKEYINQSKDDPKDKLSPELKPYFQHQNVRTKAEKMQEKHKYDSQSQSKAEEIKAKQQNEAGNIEQDDDPMNKQEQFRSRLGGRKKRQLRQYQIVK